MKNKFFSLRVAPYEKGFTESTLLHSELSKLHGVLAVLSGVELKSYLPVWKYLCKNVVRCSEEVPKLVLFLKKKSIISFSNCVLYFYNPGTLGPRKKTDF